VSDKTYRVVVTRERGNWLADVPELEGSQTWAKNLPALDTAVREVIVLGDDLPDGAEADVRIEYEYNIGNPELDALTADLRARRVRIAQEEQELAKRTAEVALRLVQGESLPVRDAAALLAVSPQRISQVAPSMGRSVVITKTARSGGVMTPSRRSTAAAKLNKQTG
jgi:hypothetical protein